MKSIIRALKEHEISSDAIEKKGTTHLLVKGDCQEVMKYMPAESVDLVITDPPYNKSLDYGSTFDDRKPVAEYYKWLKQKLSDIPRLLSPSGSFYLISYPEINARILPFLEDELGLVYQRWITWHYPTNIGHSYRNFTRSQRSILFFTKKKDDYIFNRENLTQPYKNPTAPVIKKRLAEGHKGRTSYDMLRLMDLYELNKSFAYSGN